MPKPPRYYIALAFLPVILATATLLFLYYYQQGEEQRRNSWQKPRVIFDKMGLGPGMQVAEWDPQDTYFLTRLIQRIGPEGQVYAVSPRPQLAEVIRRDLNEVEVVEQLPRELEAVLILQLKASEQDPEDLEAKLGICFSRLKRGGRVGLIGIGSENLRGFIKKDVATDIASNIGFAVSPGESILAPQFFILLEKPL